MSSNHNVQRNRIWINLLQQECSVAIGHHTFCFLMISSDSILDVSRNWMAVSSSRMFPSDDDRVYRILSSISFSCFLLLALVMIRAWRSVSSSGLTDRQHMISVTSASMFVCLSVRSHTSKTKRPNFAKFSVRVTYACGSVLLRRKYDTSCTSVLWMTSRFHIMEGIGQIVSFSSPGGGTWGEVCRLWLHLVVVVVITDIWISSSSLLSLSIITNAG